MTQPWIYKESQGYVEAAYTQRYRMLPHLYSLMYKANQNGMLAMRPLFLKFPEGKKYYSNNNFIFMLGKDVLVVNMVELKARTGTIYLPSGCRWFDMNDNLGEYSGGRTIELPVNLSSTPVFLRGSAVYVANGDAKHIISNRIRHVDFLTNADTNASSVFYDDDGHTGGYKKGVCARTVINITVSNQTITHFDIRGAYESPLERVIIRLIDKRKSIFWVTVDGKRIPRYLVGDGWEEAGTGWCYSLSDRAIQVEYEIPERKSYGVIVSTEKPDLIRMVGE